MTLRTENPSPMRPALEPLLEALDVLQDQDLSRAEIAQRLEHVEGLLPLLCRFAGGRPPERVSMDDLLARYGLRRITEGLQRMALRLAPPARAVASQEARTAVPLRSSSQGGAH